MGAIIDSADSREGDGGLKAWKAYIKPLLKPWSTIPIVVASHPHADHIGGLDWLLTEYGARLLVDNGREYNSATFRKYNKHAQDSPRKADTTWQYRGRLRPRPVAATSS